MGGSLSICDTRRSRLGVSQTQVHLRFVEVLQDERRRVNLQVHLLGRVGGGWVVNRLGSVWVACECDEEARMDDTPVGGLAEAPGAA